MREPRYLVPLEEDREPRSGRPWSPVTTWTTLALAGLATVLLFELATLAPQQSISETDFSGSRVYAVRLAGAAFMFVLACSCLLQAALHLAQRASRRGGATAPAVLDIVVMTGVVVEVVLILQVGLQDRPYLNLAILAGGAAIAIVSTIRFLVVAAGGVGELVSRRRTRSDRRP